MPTSGPIPRPSFTESKYSQSQFGKSSFQSLGRAGPAPGNTSATAGGGANETGPTSPRSCRLKLLLGE